MTWGRRTIPDAMHPGADFSVLAGPTSHSKTFLSGPQTFSSQLAVARFFDLVVGVDSSSSLQIKALSSDSKPDVASTLQTMSPDYLGILNARLSESERREWLALASENDPEIFFRQVLRMERRFADQGRDDLALATADFLIGGGQEVTSAWALALRAEAQRDREALTGTGAVGPRAEVLLKRFVKEASDPTMLVGFGAASLAFKGTRFLALARLTGATEASFFTRGFGASFAASALGFCAEVPSFVLASRASREIASGPQDWRIASLGQELATAGMTLFFLKGSGFLSQRLAGSVEGTTALARWTQQALPKAGMFGGILLGKRAEEIVGLRPVADRGNFFLDGVATYFQFLAGGALAEQVFGPRFQALQRDLDVRAAWLAAGKGKAGTFPGFGAWVGAEAFAGPRASAPSLEELMRAPFQMSQNDGEKPGGKVLPFPSGKSREIRSEAAPEESTPESHRPLSPEAFAKEVRLKLRNESQQTAVMLSSLCSLSEQVQVLLAHALRGRAGLPEFEARRQALLRTYDGFLEQYRTVSRDYDETQVPLTASDAQLQAEVGTARAKARRFLDQARTLHQAVVKLFDQVPRGDAEEIQVSLHELNDKIQSAFTRSASWASSFGLPVEQEVMMEKITGLVRGIWVKDAYRGSPEESRLILEHHLKEFPLLPESSPRVDDARTPSLLLAELYGIKAYDRSLGETLLARLYPTREQEPDEIRRESSPREALRWNTDYQEPFRSWIGAYVPTLLAGFAGDTKALAKQLPSVAIFQSAETRQATPLALWWLDNALHSEGMPRDWVRRWPANSPSGRVWKLAAAAPNHGKAERVLGSEGDMAAVQHALLNFLRHPEDPRAAIEAALNAPEAIREDVVSLTGALLGAFHGKSVFSNDWMGEVLLKTVPSRPVDEATRRFMAYANREMGMAHTQDLLQETLLGAPKSSKVTSLLPLRPRVEPATRSFVTGFDERYSNGELAAIGAVWEAGVLLGFAEGEKLPAKELRNFRKDLRASIRRLETSVQSLRDFGNQVRPTLSHVLGAGVYAQIWEGLTPKLRRLETTAENLRQLRDLAKDPRVEDFETMKDLVLKTVDQWEVPEFSALKLKSGEGPIREEAIRALQEGSLLPGRSVKPPISSPLFGQRSDEDAMQAVLSAYREVEQRFPPSAEILMELYLQTLASNYWDNKEASFAGRISPSALFTVLTPAFISANRGNPTRALRELVTMRSSESPDVREAWRVSTYLALRLAEGAKPDLALLSELRLSFSHSTMAAGLEKLTNLLQHPEAEDRKDQLRLWEKSKEMRAQTLLGLYAFFTWPKDPLRAWDATNSSGADAHQVAARVAGMLASLRRYQVSQSIMAPPSMEVVGLRGVPQNESDEVPVDNFIENLDKASQTSHWVQVLDEKMKTVLSPAQRKELSKGLSRLDPQLVRVLGSAAPEHPEEALARLLQVMGLVSGFDRPELWTQDFSYYRQDSNEPMAVHLMENYSTLFGTNMPIFKAELVEGLRALPKVAISLLGHWSHDAGTTLLLAKHLGLPGLPEEKILLQSYQRWLNAPSPPSEE